MGDHQRRPSLPCPDTRCHPETTHVLSHAECRHEGHGENGACTVALPVPALPSADLLHTRSGRDAALGCFHAANSASSARRRCPPTLPQWSTPHEARTSDGVSRVTNSCNSAPDMPVPLAEFPYCLDEKQAPPILELIRVDLGGKPDHVARKCDTDIELRKPVKHLMARLRAGSFRLVVITATSNKAAAIRNSLSQHIWPSGLTIHLAIVPELLHLTASTYYGA